MKKLLLSLMALAILSSCDEDWITYNANAHISKKITVDVETSDLKSSVYEFSQTDTLSLDDEESLEEYLEYLREITIEETSIVLSGIPSGEEIIKLKIETAKDGQIAAFEHLNQNNNKIICSVAQEVIDAIGNRLMDEKLIVLTVSGQSTTAPMQLGIKLDFYSCLEVSVN